MIVNMMIVHELECLVSRQWQEQIRVFQPGQPAGCSWKKFFGAGIYRNIRLYSSTNMACRVITLYMLQYAMIHYYKQT